MSDLASQSLDLVSRELNSTLEAARAEIEDFVDGQANQEALLRAAGMLHLACGALKIVEIHGAALLAEEMEQTCRSLTELSDKAEIERGVEALTRAMVQLPAYLERLLGGGRDMALVLLPLLNDLREVRHKPLLSEGTVLLLNSGPFERRAHVAAPDRDGDFGHELQRIAQKLRPAFQTALLGWLRGEDTASNLDQLIKTSTELEQSSSAEQSKQFWSVLTGVLIALRADGLEATVTLKRLIGQADRQLKKLLDSGEAAFASAPPTELLNNLLYYIGRARCEDHRIDALRETFGLADIVPGDEQLQQAREGLAGPSVKLMRTVADAIKEDLAAAKDVLDIFVRTGMEDIQQLKPQLDMLKKIGDTLGVLGLEPARNQIQGEIQQLSIIVANNKISDPKVLEKIAATLLDVEDALDQELVNAVLPVAADSKPSEAQAQYRHVTQAVMSECIVNLAKVKEAVIRLLRDSSDFRALDQVYPQLKGITAGLLMLNKPQAVAAVERIGATIGSRLAANETPLKPQHLERLADAIVSVEYYMETVSLGRSDPWYMLDNAARCLDLLESLPRSPAKVAEIETPAAEEPPAEEPTSPPSVMEVDEDRSDPELLEIFIEEAKEEIGKIRRYLPIWTDNNENTEALIAVRRSFHTLKGSGRMVGAQLLGEFSWSVENLLNRLINKTLDPSQAMLAFVAEAADTMPALIEQLEIGITPGADIPLLMKRAEAFAEGDPAADSLTSESLQAPSTSEDQAEVAGNEMDPVLMGIFVKEMRGHLAAIREFIAAADSRKAPYAVDESLYRACHTLLGSARMANSAAAIAFAAPLDEHLGAHYDSGAGLTADGLAIMSELAGEIERMADALSTGGSYAIDAVLLGRLDSLAAVQDDSAEEPAVEAEQHDAGDQADHAAEDVASFDPEIAAIFAEEAVEILEQADAALLELGRGTNAEGQLAELQRLLHTLKGGARIAGIVAMGDLSHALETLLSSMATGNVDVNQAATDLIQQCVDQLNQMLDGIDAGQLIAIPDGLIEQIDMLASATTVPSTTSLPASEVETSAAAESVEAPETAEPSAAAGSISTSSSVELSDDQGSELKSTDYAPQKPQTPAELDSTDTAGQVAAADELADDAVAGGRPDAGLAAAVPSMEQPSTTRSAERVETARVDADLLDLMLNSSGEINIFQSRLNQQIHSIEFHLS